VEKALCLEASKNIKITLVFESQGAGLGRDASILIDSIVIVPVVDELPALQGPSVLENKEKFDYYGCRRAQLSLDEQELPVECEPFLCNIGIHNEGFAQPCECDATGATSSVCDWRGGACLCRPNIDARSCAKCAVSTYGYGPNGCTSCKCNAGGAKNDFCDGQTGQCDCYDRVQGKHCDQCQLNFWKFPSCEACQCNGFADYCNQTTGQCINCKHHTYGYNCEK
jgi:coxsackievirus/adenovirus receptor